MKYFAPDTLSNAEKLKVKSKSSSYMGGGTIINWRGAPNTDIIIDLKNLGLNEIKTEKTAVKIGAVVTIQKLADSKLLPESIRLAACCVTSRNIRNMATVGGTVAGSFFVSNLLPAFLVYRSKVEYFLEGKKSVSSLEEWLKTKKGIVCSIIINKPDRIVKIKEEKIAAIDFPAIVTAVGFNLVRGKIKDPVVAVSGASSKKCEMLCESMKYLYTKNINLVDYRELNKIAQKELSPTGNVKVTPRVKRRFIENHLKEITEELMKERG